MPTKTIRPPRGANLKPSDIDRVRELAASVDCILDCDLEALADVKPSTSEAWAKRGSGPEHVIFGNRRLYPRAKLRAFIESKQSGTDMGGLL